MYLLSYHRAEQAVAKSVHDASTARDGEDFLANFVGRRNKKIRFKKDAADANKTHNTMTIDGDAYILGITPTPNTNAKHHLVLTYYNLLR